MKKLLCLAALFLASFGAVESSFAQTGTVVATVRPNPLRVEVIDPATVSVGQWFDITADITNLGTETIAKTMVTIYTPSEISVKGQKKRIGNLTGGQTQTLVWEAKANASGSFIIQVEVKGNLAGEEISASDTTLISASSSALANFWRRLVFGG